MEISTIMEIVKTVDDSGATLYQCDVTVNSLTHEERNAIGTAIANKVIQETNAGHLAIVQILLDSAAAAIGLNQNYQALLAEFSTLVEKNHQLIFNHGTEKNV